MQRTQPRSRRARLGSFGGRGPPSRVSPSPEPASDRQPLVTKPSLASLLPRCGGRRQDRIAASYKDAGGLDLSPAGPNELSEGLPVSRRDGLRAPFSATSSLQETGASQPGWHLLALRREFVSGKRQTNRTRDLGLRRKEDGRQLQRRRRSGFKASFSPSCRTPWYPDLLGLASAWYRERGLNSLPCMPSFPRTHPVTGSSPI